MNTDPPISFCPIHVFARQHDLTMLIEGEPGRYNAHFVGAEIPEQDHHRLVVGHGTTMVNSINDYARQIEGKRLIIGYPINSRIVLCPDNFTTFTKTHIEELLVRLTINPHNTPYSEPPLLSDKDKTDIANKVSRFVLENLSDAIKEAYSKTA